jgi:hypothetical protein
MKRKAAATELRALLQGKPSQQVEERLMGMDEQSLQAIHELFGH